MTQYEAVELLRQEGFPITRSRLKYAQDYGHLQRPPKDSSGRFVYDESRLRVLRAYFLNPPKPGRQKP